MAIGDKITELLKSSSKTGIYLPAAYDAEKDGPSVTLLFSHITFTLALFLTALLAFRPGVLTATITCIMFWIMATVFYLIRRLKTFKADLDDKSVELTGDTESDDKEKHTDKN